MRFVDTSNAWRGWIQSSIKKFCRIDYMPLEQGIPSLFTCTAEMIKSPFSVNNKFTFSYARTTVAEAGFLSENYDRETFTVAFGFSCEWGSVCCSFSSLHSKTTTGNKVDLNTWITWSQRHVFNQGGPRGVLVSLAKFRFPTFAYTQARVSADVIDQLLIF